MPQVRLWCLLGKPSRPYSYSSETDTDSILTARDGVTAAAHRPSFLVSNACLDEFHHVMDDNEKFERALVILLDEHTKDLIHNVQAR